MFTATKLIHFCYGHRLLEHQGKCRHLHGHNAVAEISIEKPKLDARGMAMDFDDIKAVVQLWIDSELDHRTILCAKDPLVKPLKDKGEPIVTLPVNPTAEALARHIYEYARGRGLPVSSVRLWETPNNCAAYKE